MHWCECRFLYYMESANQLVVSTQEACEHFKIVLLALNEVFVHLAVFIWTNMQRYPSSIWSNQPLVKHCSKSGNSIGLLLLVHGQVQNNLYFKVMKCLWEEELGAQGSLIIYDISSFFFTIDSERTLDVIGLFQTIFDCLIGQPIGAQQGLLIVPVEMTWQTGYQEVRHGG